MRRKETNRQSDIPNVHRAAVGLTSRSRSREKNQAMSILEAMTEFHGIWTVSSGSIGLSDLYLSAPGYSGRGSAHRQLLLASMMHVDDRSTFEDRLNGYLALRTPALDCEFRLRTRAGQYRWFQLSGKMIRRGRREADSEIAYLVRDIQAIKEQQEEILASRDELMAVLQASHECIAVVDPVEFRLTAFNNAFKDLIFEAHGVHVSNGMCAEDVCSERAEEWKGFLRKVLAERNVACDYEFPGLDVTQHVFAQTLERNGRVHGLCIIGSDITDRQRMESALRRSEEKFGKAFRQAPMALSLTSLIDDRYIDVNDAYVEATGHSREDLIGKTPSNAGICESPKEQAKVAKELKTAGEVRNLELRYRTKSGELRDAMGSATLIEVENEPCKLTIVVDITERKRVIEALQESEERLRIAIEAGHMYAFEWDVASDIVERPIQSLRMLDLPIGRPKGSKQELIDCMLPEDRKKYMRALQSLKPGKPEYKTVFRLPMRDGNMAWLEESGRAIFAPSGKLRKIIGITSNVTEVRESERILRELSGRLITSQEEERCRIARELHDHIGQEAALICVAAQRLDSGVADEEQTAHSDVHELYRKIKTLASDVSRLSHRLHSSELSFLGLAVAAEHLCRDFAHEYGVDVDYQPKALPPKLDRVRSLCLYRVLQEALQNVVRHSHALQVVVELRAVKNELVLEVRDNGEGFDVGKTGSGLGLLSMRERLNFVGGRFAVASKPGYGTNVTAVVAI